MTAQPQPIRNGPSSLPASPSAWKQLQPERRPSVQMGEKSQAERIKHKLEFLSDMIVGIDLLFVLLVSSLLTLLVNRLGHGSSWLSFLSESKAAIATLGAFYSFALVFRTNICYARWWEGRTLWGTMTVYSIRVVQQGRLWIDDEALVHRLSCLAILFAYTCKAQLRGNSLQDDEEDGAKLVRRGVISKEELDIIATQKAWQPYYCIDAMRATIDEGLLQADSAHMNYWRESVAQSAMEETICTLASSIGGCLKVRSTGLPVAYDDILYAIGAIFFTAACVAWAPGVGFYNPIIVLIVYIVAKLIVSVGNDMEDPFGHDESDLPLEKFCATIEKQINAVEERARMFRSINKSCFTPPPASESMDSSYNTFASTATPAHSVQRSYHGDVETGQMSETYSLVMA